MKLILEALFFLNLLFLLIDLGKYKERTCSKKWFWQIRSIFIPLLIFEGSLIAALIGIYIVAVISFGETDPTLLLKHLGG